MTAKEYLSQARRLQARLDQLEKARERAWEKATATTSNGSMPVSGGDISRKTESFAELTSIIDSEYNELCAVKADILKTISLIKDNRYAALLIAYYINGLTWAETAEALGYTFEHVARELHPRALNVVDKLIREKMS